MGIWRTSNRDDEIELRSHRFTRVAYGYQQIPAKEPVTSIAHLAQGPSEAVGKQDATRPNTRSKTRTVDGAATHRRARIKVQGGVAAPAAMRMKEMGGVNVAIEVGKNSWISRWVVMESCSPSLTSHAQLRDPQNGLPS